MVWGVGQERLGPSYFYFFMSLVIGPLNSLGCGVEVTELSTNKQHTLSYGTYFPQGKYDNHPQLVR